jgi:hypothetical protein
MLRYLLLITSIVSATTITIDSNDYISTNIKSNSNYITLNISSADYFSAYILNYDDYITYYYSKDYQNQNILPNCYNTITCNASIDLEFTMDYILLIQNNENYNNTVTYFIETEQIPQKLLWGVIIGSLLGLFGIIMIIIVAWYFIKKKYDIQ